jgi:predicted dehydrogenase
MQTTTNRRTFLKQASTITLSFTALGGFNILRAQESPAKKLVVGVMGCTNRGMNHIAGLLGVTNVEIAYICDVDRRAMDKGIAAVTKKQSRAPKGISDFRQMLEDKNVDAITIAAPDHWHAPATILACAAGKHVYVEKPGSHNGHEGELIVAAARKHKRLVQMGAQRRSLKWMQEAIAALHAGEIGEISLARTWYTNKRKPIGHGNRVPVPEWLDYNLWQGPAPEEPYRDNILHYNWHWFWKWGTSELGNNGVHALDLARWGMKADLPRRVTCGGGRYHAQDDWEVPDTMVTTFDFGNCFAVFEGQSCDPRGFEDASFGVTFHGEKGAMAIAGDTVRVFDLNNKLVRELKGKRDDVAHFANFADAIRDGKKLNADIEEGQKATLLCHLGNIAQRSGQTVNYDPIAKKMSNGGNARKLWHREYRKGWEPRV